MSLTKILNPTFDIVLFAVQNKRDESVESAQNRHTCSDNVVSGQDCPCLRVVSKLQLVMNVPYSDVTTRLFYKTSVGCIITSIINDHIWVKDCRPAYIDIDLHI